MRMYVRSQKISQSWGLNALVSVSELKSNVSVSIKFRNVSVSTLSRTKNQKSRSHLGPRHLVYITALQYRKRLLPSLLSHDVTTMKQVKQCYNYLCNNISIKLSDLVEMSIACRASSLTGCFSWTVVQRHLTLTLAVTCSIYTVSQKNVHPFYFCDNFPNCKPIQIIFGRNIADKTWNKLTCNSFDIYSLCIASLHHKMIPIFFSMLEHKNSSVTFQTVFPMTQLTEVVFY